MATQNNLHDKIQALPRLQRWAFGVFAVVFTIALILFFHHHQYFQGHWQETFVVKQNDATRSCQRRRSGFTLRTRSDRPNNGYGHYCGFVHTNRGFYLLPENSKDYLFYDNRQEMDDKLKAGCTVTATIVGGGLPYSSKRLQRMPIVQYIAKIHNVEDC